MDRYTSELLVRQQFQRIRQMSDTPIGRIQWLTTISRTESCKEAYLADDGHEILMAVDGRETLDQARTKQPDPILWWIS